MAKASPAAPAAPAPPEYRLVHLKTKISAEFGVLDEAGNITARQPLEVVSELLSPEALAAALPALQQQARRFVESLPVPIAVPESYAALPD